MSLVNVLVNGRAYTVACDDGEEEHLRELAQYLDARVRQLTESVGQVGDGRLLLMAGLIVCDELAEALARVHELEQKLGLSTDGEEGNSAPESDEDRANAEDRAAEALEIAAGRLEDIAARIART